VESELSMMRKLFAYAREYGGRTYIVHTTCGESLEMLKAMPDIVNRKVFLESCPQYFYLNDSAFAGEDGFSYILAPPLRTVDQQKKLIDAVDVLHSIGTDHCPFMWDEKNKKLLSETPFGIGGIEYSFPLMFSLFGEKIIDKMTVNPAKTFHLYPRKGIIAEGADADFFLYDDRKKHPIEENHSACDYSLYQGRTVRGKVTATVIGGDIRMRNGKFYPGKGEFLEREVLNAGD